MIIIFLYDDILIFSRGVCQPYLCSPDTPIQKARPTGIRPAVILIFNDNVNHLEY